MSNNAGVKIYALAKDMIRACVAAGVFGSGVLSSGISIVLICMITTLCLLTIYILNAPAVRFPPTLVINLPERTDRWKAVSDMFASWPVPVERTNAIKQSPGWKGCTLSHLQCLQIAHRRNYPWVLCIEDDCVLTKDAQQRFQALLPHLWANRGKWDVFSGGVTFLTDHTRIQSHPPLFEVSGYAAHFVLIHRDAYIRIIRALTNAMQALPKIDVFYAEHMRIWTTAPYLAMQKPDTSDIEQSYKNYTQRLQESEHILLSDR